MPYDFLTCTNNKMLQYFVLICFAFVGQSFAASSFLVGNDPSFFTTIVDPNATLNILSQQTFAFAHEAPVWMASTNELFLVSNRLDSNNQTVSGASNQPQHIFMAKLQLDTSKLTIFDSTPDILMANGAAPLSNDEIVVSSQGYYSTNGGLFRLNLKTLQAVEIVDSFNYAHFNSPNDAIYSNVYHGYFFTDPPYGYAQGFRSAPQLPPSVYFYSERTGKIKALVQNMTKPNGVAISLDSKTLYVTDTGFFTGPSTDPNGPRNIYTFDVTVDSDGAPALSNQKTFAVADNGAPDGIKLDNLGNIYTGVGGAVNVYSPSGVFLGKILATGGVSNLVFAKDTLIILAETQVFSVKLKVQGAPLSLL